MSSDTDDTSDAACVSRAARCCGVLIVEDDPAIRETIAEILQDEGYPVLEASDGGQALALLRDGAQPCLVLLDLMMPVMDGAMFRRAQRADPALRDIPVVVISAYRDIENDAHELGVNGLLRKPIGLSELMEAVTTYCTVT